MRKPHKVTKIDRSLAEKASEWKLPPNVYRLGDFTTELKQMGKRGPYQCFTVERDDKTVRNHHVPKPNDECCETDYYDLPSPLDDGMKPWNSHKSKFLKAERFTEMGLNSETPAPAKYFPQNFAIKSSENNGRAKSKAKIIEVDPVFYYPNTTVPEMEMKFNKPIINPEPGRYNLHNLTCRCHMKGTNDRNIFTGERFDEGQQYLNLNLASDRVESESYEGDEESYYEGAEKLKEKKKSIDDMSISKRIFNRERELISFHPKLSKSLEDLTASPREFRFNTMIKRKNVFSTKTGRPVAFLSAAPRFQETADKPIKLYEKTKVNGKTVTTKSEADSKPKSKSPTMKRIEELALPKSLQLKRSTDKIQIFAQLPQPSLKYFADRFKVSSRKSAFSFFSLRKLREIAKKEEEVVEEEIVDDSQLNQIVISK